MKSPYISLDVNASPKNEKVRLSKAWEDFVSGKDFDVKVRTFTQQSWERSLKHGIHPAQQIAPLTLTEEQILNYKSSNPLYSIIKPILSELKEVAIDSGHLVVFSNNSGEIIDVEGDVKLKSAAEKMNFAVGTSWLENNIGTNAIGTALATGTPMQIFASEHFCEPVHNWVCSAAPVRDPATKGIIGVVDLTGEWSLIHPHSLTTAISISQSIEGRLLNLLELDRYKLLEHYLETSIKFPKRISAVLDRGGYVIKANHLFYSNGWIDITNHIPELKNVSLMHEQRWKTNNDGWSFELTPIYFEGKFIGSVVQAISTKVSVTIPGYTNEHNNNNNNNNNNNLRYSFSHLIGCSKEFKSVIAEAQSIANLNLPVLIEGESGTGKELFAQSIHAASSRSFGPFVAVNCGAIHKDLAESELFGYEEGTFTGGQKGGRAGKFQQADGGTIFLDEIGEMPLNLQTILLRVLEEGEVVRLGGKKPIKLNVRVIAATNRDLKKASEEGKFRLDLYYRLNILSLKIPPLRERTGDIPVILEDLLNKVCNQMGRSPLRIENTALKFLERYEWPGNVRELRNFVYKMAVKVQNSPFVTISDLPNEIMDSQNQKYDNNYNTPYPGQDSKGDSPLLPPPNETISDIQLLKEQELKTILNVLEEVNGNVQEAAKRLGIHRSTIYRKLSRINGDRLNKRSK
ncbi:sigma-54-dependent Fis family transcriptional regulator [Neobacillus sp. Marseille-QA0830]